MHDTTTCEDSNLVSVCGALEGVTTKALDLVFGELSPGKGCYADDVSVAL